jgi:hypothetical protein
MSQAQLEACLAQLSAFIDTSTQLTAEIESLKRRVEQLEGSRQSDSTSLVSTSSNLVPTNAGVSRPIPQFETFPGWRSKVFFDDPPARVDALVRQDRFYRIWNGIPVCCVCKKQKGGKGLVQMWNTIHMNGPVHQQNLQYSDAELEQLVHGFRADPEWGAWGDLHPPSTPPRTGLLGLFADLAAAAPPLPKAAPNLAAAQRPPAPAAALPKPAPPFAAAQSPPAPAAALLQAAAPFAAEQSPPAPAAALLQAAPTLAAAPASAAQPSASAAAAGPEDRAADFTWTEKEWTHEQWAEWRLKH